ncbi:MAG: phospholipid methyltransferase [Pseudomonadota bacterium]
MSFHQPELKPRPSPRSVASKLLDEGRFLRQLASNPSAVGAIAPSGPKLAQAMASYLDTGAAGTVVELGPGTGVVTKAILDAGVAAERLTCVEYSDAFAGLLAKRFPSANIVTGDAFDLKSALREVPGAVTGIVSSLPLMNSPKGKRRDLLGQAFELLEPSAPFIQFSYALTPPIRPEPGVFTVEKSRWIVRNVPPARVWVYRKIAS